MPIYLISCKIQIINNNFSNLLIPSGFKMGTTHLAKYSIKLYKGEIIHYLFGKGTKWLSIDFGEAPEVRIYLFRIIIKLELKIKMY